MSFPAGDWPIEEFAARRRALLEAEAERGRWKSL
jgi:hypothetical protein